MVQVSHVLDSEQPLVNHWLDKIKQIGILNSFVIRRHGAKATLVIVANYRNAIGPLSGSAVFTLEE
jgi:hypothetical protein